MIRTSTPNKNPFTGKKLLSSNGAVRRQEPLWKGPDVDGITFSLLTKFLECRERFRLKVVEGYQDDEGFSKALEFGNYWHAAEEAHSGGKDFLPALHKHRSFLYNQYPDSQAEILKWFEVAKVTFPHYINFWKKHPDEKNRKPFIEEVAFKVPYTLPSGRKIFLRGKKDCLLALGRELFLQENKSKGEIDEQGIQRTVDQNLQTMLYQIAARASLVLTGHEQQEYRYLVGVPPIVLPRSKQPYKIGGVIYNVVRRPLSDRYAIKPRKAEENDLSLFYTRLGEVIAEDPKKYFMRWKVSLTDADIERFKVRVFHPILEQLMDWWEWIKVDPFDPWHPRKPSELDEKYAEEMSRQGKGFSVQLATQVLKELDEPIQNTRHFQSPWGCYNSLAGGFRGSFFEYLTTGRKHSLTRIKSLFPELDVLCPQSKSPNGSSPPTSVKSGKSKSS